MSNPFKRDHKQTAIALRLGAVTCPKCKARQPQKRWPRNLRQFFFGGWTCQSCQTEMDAFGRAIFQY